MKEIIKTIWFLSTFFLLFAKRLIDQKVFPTSRVTILLLHDVSNEQQNKLVKLIKILQHLGRFISLDEFEKYSKNKKLTPKEPLFLITFDDGFSSSGHFAKKYLDPMGIKATFFICPNFIGKQKKDSNLFIVNNLFLGDYDYANISDYQTPMAHGEIQSLINSGHSIGSHSFNHKKLSAIIDPAELSVEILDSKHELEKAFNIPVNCFAYPFGDIGSISHNALEIISRHYDLNFTGIRGVYKDSKSFKNGIWRQSINLDDSFYYCAFCALGGLDPFYTSVQKAYKALLN